jgi:allantoin racemase
MKILTLIPWVAKEEFINYHRSSLPGDVDVACLRESSLADTKNNIVRNLPAIVDTIQDAEKQGYNAVVVACMSDPGVEIARKYVSIPVLGSLNVSLHVSQIIGHRTLLLVPELARTRFQFPDIITTYGLRDRVVLRGSYASIPEALEAYRNYKATSTMNPFATEMVNICMKSIEEDGIDVIVLGCGSIRWMKEVLESELAKKGYRITIIAPVPLAVEMAKVLLTRGLSHNKTGYPFRPGEYIVSEVAGHKVS